MEMMLGKIQRIGIVPVVVLKRKEDAEPLCEALLEGGISCAEITFRTEAASECIRLMSKKYPEMLIGAGTVLTNEQVDMAEQAGAKFIVTPGFHEDIVLRCITKQMPIIPGIMTPTELGLAMAHRLDVVKFFPSEQAGGLKMIKAMAAPYQNVLFMPTGGISRENVREYLSYQKVFACGGSWMVRENLIAEGRFDEITRLSREAMDIVKEVRGGK